MMLISVSLNLLFLTLFIRSFSEFKNNKFVLPAFNSVVFKSEWNDILWPMDYSTFESVLHYVYVQR